MTAQPALPDCSAPAQARIQTLRKAAKSVFVELGYVAATMDDVARAAGMSKRTVYQLFPSKAALFEAVIEDHLAPLHIDTALEDDPDLEAALVGMLEAVALHVLSPDQAGIFRLLVSEASRSPELVAAFHRAGPGRGAGAIERRILREIASGRIRVTDPGTAVHMLFSMAIGSVQVAVLLGMRELPDRAEISGRVREAVAIFLRGVLDPMA